MWHFTRFSRCLPRDSQKNGNSLRSSFFVRPFSFKTHRKPIVIQSSFMFKKYLFHPLSFISVSREVINCTFIDPSTGYYFPGFAAFVSSVNEVEDVLPGMLEHFLEYLDSGYLDKDGIHVDRIRAHIYRLACAISGYQEIPLITQYSEMCATLRIQLEETIQMLEVCLHKV